MENAVSLTCAHCGTETVFSVPENEPDAEAVSCSNCGERIATVGQMHAIIAQQAAGIGASELLDDHVPLGGPPFGETT